MESILLELHEDLMDMDEAANLLMQWGVLTEREVERLDEALEEASEQQEVNLSQANCLTLALIELLQMAPPTHSLH